MEKMHKFNVYCEEGKCHKCEENPENYDLNDQQLLIKK